MRPDCPKTEAVDWPSIRERFAEYSGRARLVLLALVCGASPAAAWWNDEWTLRKTITIDTSPTGANITEPIGTAPVLIRLHAGNFRFGQAKEDGSDLRFVAADDKTPLEYHIEKYDSLLGEAFVWVAVPNMKPGAKEALWLYYGNTKAQPVANAKTTYDPNMVLVYHASERGIPQDSSRWANHAKSGGQHVDGAIIGGALHLDGTAPLTLPVSPSLALSERGEFTWSAWIKPSAPQSNAVIYSRREGSGGIVIGLEAGSPFIELTVNGNVQRSVAATAVAPSGWFHLAVSAVPGRVTVYLNGTSYATLDATLPALNSAAFVGADPASAGPASDAAAESTDSSPDTPPATAASGFTGDIDELQISNVARSAGFVESSVIGQGPDHGKLVTYGTDEEMSSWVSGYFVVILQSVTLDGWVVIGLLAIMAIISWVVMIGKVGYVNRQSKANARFKRYYRQLASDLALRCRGGGDHTSSLSQRIDPRDLGIIHHSSLYRVYQIGAAEIHDRFVDADTPLVLSSNSLAAIRAALDGGLVRENQRLNNLMVLLTIAISGGPFLGLLGTVVGVMITFAAIAASGDVNVNAIAPGIAAALVATVAGLGVAIPALFGYNYLITRIKDLSADMQVFVDEFTTQMAEDFDTTTGRRPRSLAAE